MPSRRKPKEPLNSGDDAPWTAALDRLQNMSMMIGDGVATIAVHGQLVNRVSWISAALGFGSYDGLRAALSAATCDTSVKGVLLDVDSPGGDLAGAAETASAIRSIAARKPVVAFVDS